MMDSTSSFAGGQSAFPDAELLAVGGTTCQCYRVKRYGKLHFLKRLKSELRTHPQYVAALQKEFETGYSLDHPHLVRYVSKTDDGILMDYVDGETLSQFIEHHPGYFKSRKNADRFLRQLLSVVGYLHIHQIVHLDLKPANILITRVGKDVKLVDLGYCYADCYTDTMGRTDKYAAPEQLNGSGNVDARTDIYAIGRILQTLPCAHKYNKVIARCTKTERDDRYNSVEEIQQALRRRSPWWLFLLLPVIAFVVFMLFYQRLATLTPVVEEQNDTTATKDIPSPGQNNNDDSSMVPLPPSISHQPDPVPLVSSVQEESPSVPSVPDVKEPIVGEDTLALRRELQQLIGPRFRKALGHYSDSIYSHINEQHFSQEWADFEESLRPIYTQVWEKYKDKVAKHTMQSEYHQTILYYRIPQFWQMMRNEPGHDPWYDGKVFNYYDFEQ